MLETPAERIAARKKFLEEVVGFVSAILEERGIVVRRSATNVVRELENFADFSFKLNTASVGGSDISISYRPSGKGEFATVLIACWHSLLFDANECRVQFFNKKIRWELPLSSVIRNKEKVSAVIDERGVEFEKRKRDEEELKRLDSEAKRLGL